MTIAIERNVDDSSGARVDAARKRAGLVFAEAVRADGHAGAARPAGAMAGARFLLESEGFTRYDNDRERGKWRIPVKTQLLAAVAVVYISANLVNGQAPVVDDVRLRNSELLTPPPSEHVVLSIAREPGMGFCPLPGMLLSATVWADNDGIFWQRGLKIVRSTAETAECLFPSPAWDCYVAVPVPDRPLGDQQRTELVKLVDALPASCDAWDWACDPCVVTDFAIESHEYVLGCGSPEPCADTLEAIGRLLDDVAKTCVLDLYAFEGLYPEWGAQQRHSVDLGFSLFRIEGLAIYWAGSVNTGIFDCYQKEACGFGGFFVASLVGTYVSREVLDCRPDTWVRFSAVDRLDLASATKLDELLDGAADVEITFPWIFQKWLVLVSPAGALDTTMLLVTGSRMHDADGDGSVRGPDIVPFVGCLAGPGVIVRPGCRIFDADRDGDIDLFDVAGLQREFDGP